MLYIRAERVFECGYNSAVIVERPKTKKENEREGILKADFNFFFFCINRQKKLLPGPRVFSDGEANKAAHSIYREGRLSLSRRSAFSAKSV